MIHSPNPSHAFGMQNFGGFADPELDRAIERSAAIEQSGDRRNALQAIMKEVMERLVLIPLYNDQDVWAVDKSLSWSPRSDSYVLAAEIAERR